MEHDPPPLTYPEALAYPLSAVDAERLYDRAMALSTPDGFREMDQLTLIAFLQAGFVLEDFLDSQAEILRTLHRLNVAGPSGTENPRRYIEQLFEAVTGETFPGSAGA